jgi:hypothetical protein
MAHSNKNLDKVSHRNYNLILIDYTNVHYLEDRFSHAKCHNELIKAKEIAIIGGTFEAY